MKSLLFILNFLVSSTIAASLISSEPQLGARSIRYTENGACGGPKGLHCRHEDCCSKWGWCGSSAEFCEKGCQSEFGSCGGDKPLNQHHDHDRDHRGHNDNPKHSGHRYPTDDDDDDDEQKDHQISKDGKCHDNGRTCKGSKFGSCCSKWGWCGDTRTHCGTGCNPNFGDCQGSSKPNHNQESIKKSSTRQPVPKFSSRTGVSSIPSQPSAHNVGSSSTRSYQYPSRTMIRSIISRISTRSSSSADRPSTKSTSSASTWSSSKVMDSSSSSSQVPTSSASVDIPLSQSPSSASSSSESSTKPSGSSTASLYSENLSSGSSSSSLSSTSSTIASGLSSSSTHSLDISSSSVYSDNSSSNSATVPTISSRASSITPSISTTSSSESSATSSTSATATSLTSSFSPAESSTLSSTSSSTDSLFSTVSSSVTSGTLSSSTATAISASDSSSTSSTYSSSSTPYDTSSTASSTASSATSETSTSISSDTSTISSSQSSSSSPVSSSSFSSESMSSSSSSIYSSTISTSSSTVSITISSTSSLVPSASASATCHGDELKTPDCSAGSISWNAVTDANCLNFSGFCLSDFPGFYVSCSQQRKRHDKRERGSVAPNSGTSKQKAPILHVCPSANPIPPAPADNCYLNCWGHVSLDSVLKTFRQDPSTCFSQEHYCLTDYPNATLLCDPTHTDPYIWVCPRKVQQAPPPAPNCTARCDSGSVAFSDITTKDACYNHSWACLTDFPGYTLACDSKTLPFTLQYSCPIVRQQTPPSDNCYPRCTKGSVAFADITADNCSKYENYCLSDHANATLACSTSNSYKISFDCPGMQKQMGPPAPNCVASCQGSVNFTDIIANPASCLDRQASCLIDHPGYTLTCSQYDNFQMDYICPTVIKKPAPPTSGANYTESCRGQVSYSDVLANPKSCYANNYYCLTDYPDSILTCIYNDPNIQFEYDGPIIIPQAPPKSPTCAAKCTGYVAFSDILANPSSCSRYTGYCLSDHLNSTLACSTTDGHKDDKLEYICPTVTQQTPPPSSSCVGYCSGYVAFSDVLANPSNCYNWQNYCLTDYDHATLSCGGAYDRAYSLFYVCPQITPQKAPPSGCGLACTGRVAYADVLKDPMKCYDWVNYCLTDVPNSILSCNGGRNYQLDFFCPFTVPHTPPSDTCVPDCWIGSATYADILADPSLCRKYQNQCLTDVPNATLGCVDRDKNWTLDFICPSITQQPKPTSDNCTANCQGYVKYADIMSNPQSCGNYENFCLSDNLNSTLGCYTWRTGYNLGYNCPV